MDEVKHHPAMEKLRRNLGLAIRDRRKALRLSQEELAERLGLHRNYISLVERGLQNITIETLCKLATVLACRPSDLLSEMETAFQTEAPAAPPSPPVPPGYSFDSIRFPSWKVAEEGP